MPAHGVYFCKIDIEGKTYPGIANVGIKTDRDRRKEEAVDRGISFRIFRKCIRGKSTD